jgi:hypothetical protein
MLVLVLVLPPSCWECIGLCASRTLFLWQSYGVRHKEHVKSLIHLLKVEDLVIQQIPQLKDKIEVSPVD